MSDVTRMTAAQIADLIAKKDVSAVEVTTAHLDRIGAVDERVHAFLHVDREGALVAAATFALPKTAMPTRPALLAASRSRREIPSLSLMGSLDGCWAVHRTRPAYLPV